MRATILVLSVLWASACGGVAARDKPTEGSQPPDSGRAGGATTPVEMIPGGTIEVVDDVDHADSQYPPVPAGSSAFFWRGGLGNWFVSVSDGSVPRNATTDSVIPPRAESTKAYHVRQLQEGTAVDLWAQLNHPRGTAVDLASYSGVAFWARLNSPSAELTVAFGADGDLAKVASVPHKVVVLSEDWAQFIVRFDDLGVDKTTVSSIDFVVHGRGGPIDLWVDDLALMCAGTCP